MEDLVAYREKFWYLFDNSRRRWLAGECPCCSGALDDSIDGTACLTVAEQVEICGTCAEREHHLIDDGMFLKTLLLSLLPGSADEPLARRSSGE